MHDWRERYIDLFSSADTESVLFERVKQVVRELGFDYCSYGMPRPPSGQHA